MTYGFDSIKINSESPTNEMVYNSILNSYKNENVSSNYQNIIEKVLSSYSKKLNNEVLAEDDFILTDHELNEFKTQEEKNIIRYVVYRYKYNIYPIIKKVSDYPPNLQIELSSICNLRCVMCYQADKTFSGKSNGFMGYMKFDLFKKIIDEVEGNIDGLTFASRGEPTLIKDFDKYLKYCEGKFLGLKINTNVTLFNEKLINTLLSSDIQTLVLSIDESNKENYEKIRVNAKFDKIMKNLEMLKEIREKNYKNSKLKVRISGVKINKDQNIEEINKFYKDFADEIALVNYTPWESSYENEVNQISDPCSDLFRRMFIWWDGKANPCDYDYKSLLSKWDAKFLTVNEIWNSNYYNEIRFKHLNNMRDEIEPCKRCIAT